MRFSRPDASVGKREEGFGEAALQRFAAFTPALRWSLFRLEIASSRGVFAERHSAAVFSCALNRY
jgi:hypothetical protein